MNNTTKKTLEKEVKKYFTNIKPKISGIIESAVLSLIGLERRGSDYEIDHYNHRSSVLTDVFKRMAQEEAEKIASSYKPTKEDIIGFKKAVESEYKSQFRYAMRSVIEQRVKKDTEEMLLEIKPNIDDLVKELYES